MNATVMKRVEVIQTGRADGEAVTGKAFVQLESPGHVAPCAMLILFGEFDLAGDWTFGQVLQIPGSQPVDEADSSVLQFAIHQLNVLPRDNSQRRPSPGAVGELVTVVPIVVPTFSVAGSRADQLFRRSLAMR
jgi:hypothetical protein